MHSFTHDQPAARVIFGVGAFDRLADEVKRLGATRALVLSTPEQVNVAEEAGRRLGELAARHFPPGGDARPDRNRARGESNGPAARCRLLRGHWGRLHNRTRQGDRAR